MNFLDRISPVGDAISGGVFDPQGMNYTDFSGRFDAAFPNRSRGSSGLRYSDTGYGESVTRGGSIVTPGGGVGGSTRIQPSPTDPSTWSIPSIGDVLSGMASGPGGDKPVDIGLQSGLQGYLSGIGASIEAWIPRLVLIVLGLIFVAIGLSLFGVRTPIGQEIVRETQRAIR